MTEFSAELMADLLPMYYSRLFPYNDYYRWLSYGDPDLFARREFSFNIQDDIYIRNRSFQTRNQFEAELRRLLPNKIDIGAVYNIEPKDERRALTFTPVEKELVFDIDMTDYDDTRTCCTGTDICAKCWKYITIACTVLDTALREDFGFEHLLWVFSGRRGIHCWVCDKAARILEPIVRSSVAEYLQLVTGGEHKAKKVILTGDKLHSSVKRAVNIIEPMFVPMCVVEQNMLGTDEGIAKFLQLIPDDALRTEIKELFKKSTTSADRWEDFVMHFRNHQQSGQRKNWRLRHLLEEIMLQYSYPRLDINVSKGMNHLLKSPFCVHPKTGKVCVPINPRAASKFNPMTVPTINLLSDEINKFDARENSTQEGHACTPGRIKDYKKTSLNKSLHVFQEFLRNMEDSRKGQKILESDMQMQF